MIEKLYIDEYEFHVKKINTYICIRFKCFIYVKECPTGYYWLNCNKSCSFPYYGKRCDHNCLCQEELCDFVTGCRNCKFFQLTNKILKMCKYMTVLSDIYLTNNNDLTW